MSTSLLTYLLTVGGVALTLLLLALFVGAWMERTFFPPFPLEKEGGEAEDAKGRGQDTGNGCAQDAPARTQDAPPQGAPRTLVIGPRGHHQERVKALLRERDRAGRNGRNEQRTRKDGRHAR